MRIFEVFQKFALKIKKIDRLKTVYLCFCIVLATTALTTTYVFKTKHHSSVLPAQTERESADSLAAKDTSGELKPKSGEKEIVDKRTENFKTFQLSDGTFRAVGSTEPIHYREDPFNNSEPLKEIDLTIHSNTPSEDKSWNWEMSKNDFQVRVWNSTKADDKEILDKAEFRLAGKSLQMAPLQLIWQNDAGDIQVISQVKNVGEPQIDNDNYTITWPNAFGDGIDFRYNISASRFFKTVIVNKKENLPEPKIDSKGLKLAIQMALSWDESVQNDDFSKDQNTGALKSVEDISMGSVPQIQASEIPILSQTPIASIVLSATAISTATTVPAPSPEISKTDSFTEIVKEPKPDEQLTTDKSIVYKDDQNRNLWSLQQPKAWDSSTGPDDVVLNPEQTLKRIGDKVVGEISLSKHQTDNSKLVFPLFIDTDVTEQVGDSADDAQRVTGGSDTWTTTGAAMYFGTHYALEKQYNYDNWYRFTTVPIPNGVTISSASLSLKAYNNQSNNSVNVKIRAQDEDSATQIADGTSYDGATWTSAEANWNAVEAFTGGIWYSSPSITSVVGEVTSRPGWASNNNIGFQVANNGSTTGVSQNRRGISSYDSGASNAPKLLVSYSTGGITVSGTVYAAENKSTNIGSDKTVALSINGGEKTTVETGAGGTFSFSPITVAANNTVAVYISGETEKASLVSQATDASTNITGLELFTSHVNLTHQTAGPMTNTLLATADNVSDSDLLISVDGSSVATFTSGNTLWVISSKTYTPGGGIIAGSIKISGTLNPEANSVSASGDFTIDASGSWTSSGTVTFNGSTAQTIISNGTDATHDYTNITVTNASASGTTFADSATVSGTFTDTTPSSKLTFTDGATYNFSAIDIDGSGAGDVTMTVSGSAHGHWHFIVPGTPTVTYVTVDHSDATGSGAEIDATSNCHDGNDNTYWDFGGGGNPPVNDSLTFKNPYSTNVAIADDTTSWDFEAKVTNADGGAGLTYVEFRLANATDSTQPYDSLKFRWTQSGDAFTEEADTQDAATITSTSADSVLVGNQWTLDFKIKLNNNFLNKDTNYATELYSLNSSALSDNDNYVDKYQVSGLSLTLDVDQDTISFGNLLPGSVITGTTTTTVTTNYPNGYSLAASDGVAGSGSCLLHTDASTRIADYAGTIATPTSWTGTGLGICLYSATGKDTSKWGTGTMETDSNNKYAGVPETATVIHSKVGAPTSADESKSGYKLVVPNTQKTGAYSGNITYTATGALN